jgi:hypothetical protein
MPYVNKPRPYKKEYQQQLDRGEGDERLQRQRARASVDKQGIDRRGKDVSHVKALSRGGSNDDGVTLQAPSENRSFKRTAKKQVRGAIDKPKDAHIIRL